MSAVFRRTFLAFVLVLMLLTTGAWQSDQVALAKNQAISLPDTPLYPGLTWSSVGLATQNIRINANGDSVSLSGERYVASEQFTSGLPEDVLNYYSNEQLARSGWASYDAFDGADGIQYVFYHDSGVYLSVEFLKCPQDSSSICVAVWKSEGTQPLAAATRSTTAEPNSLADATAAATSTFGKTAPANGATGLNPTSTTLSWEAYPNADKYKYCVNEGSACDKTDPDWTSTYSRSITITNLANSKTYYWQVKATTCETCVPKIWVYANNDTAWKFTTKTGAQVTILGNAGVAGAVLSYTNGSVKSVTSDSSGAYSISVPLNWSGTVTPSKSGYIFSPASASFTNLTATQTIQNFMATRVYVISGNAGLAGVILSYVNGTPQIVVSDASGNYSIVLPAGWSGTVSPVHPCYTFNPANYPYANLGANLTGQNFAPTFNPASGCANVNVVIGSASLGQYGIPSGGKLTSSFPGTFNGPVHVTSTNGKNIFVSERAIYGKSFAETLGIPANQLTTDYWFPWYDGLTMRTWISIGAPTSNTQAALVDIYIGGTKMNATSYQVAPGGQVSPTPNFQGTFNGPVHVVSTNGQKIFTSERAIYGNSFTETLGMPGNQLTANYWFPWYDGSTMRTWISIAAPDTNTQDALVDIYIGGTKMNSTSYQVAPGGLVSPTPNFPGTFNGPVQVKSTNGQNILVSERAIYGSSFTETLGIPGNQLTTKYWFSWYDSTTMRTWISIGAPDTNTQDALVDIYIGGTKMNATSYQVAPGGLVNPTPSFLGAFNGPVQVVSTNGQKVFVSERAIFGASFAETLGMADNRLTTDYWFTWYDWLTMNTWISLGAP